MTEWTKNAQELIICCLQKADFNWEDTEDYK